MNPPAALQRVIEAPSPSPQEDLEAIAHLLARRHDEEHPAADAALAKEVHQRLEPLHPADVAYILEGLPLQDRIWVWRLVPRDRDGDILLEVSDSVRDTLLADMDSAEIVAAAQNLDADEIADLAPDLPDEVMQDIIESQDVEDRADLQQALSYREGTVGALMDFEVVSIREDVTCEVALRYLRRYDELPAQTDAVFVVDRDDHLKGALALNKLLVTDPDVEVATLYDRDVVTFRPEDDSDEAAQALGKVGLREEEDIFSSVWESARNRGPWLALNLCAAFVASRVVGLFEGSIAQLAALAALMPIVAGIGGNSGNQTSTLIVRALALGQINLANAKRLLVKELGISLVKAPSGAACWGWWHGCSTVTLPWAASWRSR